MTSFGFVCPPFTGHLNPMLALGQELVRRGHRVMVFAQADIRSNVLSAGLAFHAVGLATHPIGDLAEVTARMGRVRGLIGIRPVIHDMARTTEMLATDLPGAFAQHGIEAVVADQLEAAGGLVARHLGLPLVSIANALLINRDPAVPPFFSAWLPGSSDWALRRNQGAVDVSDWMQAKHSRVVNRFARQWGLGNLKTCADCLSPVADISQLVPGFDFPRAKKPAHLHYTGPIRQADAPPFEPLPVGIGASSKPLVFASFGTLFGGRFRQFAQIAQACLDLDLDLIIAHGGRLTDAEVRRLPGLPRVFAHVPQRALLKAAALCITHAGMNTTMDALEAGVPILALPVAFDQPGIAARVVVSQAGERLTGITSISRVRAAIARVLGDPAYRDAAHRLALEIAQAGGVDQAADIVVAATQRDHPTFESARFTDPLTR